MNTTYIFAIGGTGSRVLRSMAMFMASGCAGTAVPSQIVPIILDYDRTNGDLIRTKKVLDLYQKIHNATYNDGTDGDQQVFFCSPIKKIREKVKDGNINLGIQFNPQSGFDAFLDTTQYNIQFSDFLGYDTMNVQNGSAETQKLLSSLYNDSPEDDPMTEIRMNFSQGFLGCPNIGCLVSRHFTDTPEYKSAVACCDPKTDKILIIGSVFGGTGASGIPMLLDALRDDNRLDGVKIGVLAMLPYYQIAIDPQSPIDSRTFIAKSKAAIAAYELPNSVYDCANRVYFVGDGDNTQPFENQPGNVGQKNNALFAEFGAAMCAIDYIQTSVQNIEGNGQAFEFGYDPHQRAGVVTNARSIKWDDFYQDQTITPYIEPLMRFTIFEKFCKEYIPKKVQKNDSWYVNSKLDENKAFINDLHEFGNMLFDWLKELDNPNRGLCLFHPDKSYAEILEHKKLTKVCYWGTVTKSAYDDSDIADELGRSYKKSENKFSQRNPQYIFMQDAAVAMHQISNKILKFNS